MMEAAVTELRYRFGFSSMLRGAIPIRRRGYPHERFFNLFANAFGLSTPLARQAHSDRETTPLSYRPKKAPATKR
jgi:hypothetical protein